MRKITRRAAASAVVLGLASLAAWADADNTGDTAGPVAIDGATAISADDSNGSSAGVNGGEGGALAAAPAVYATTGDVSAIDMSHTGGISAMQVTNGFNNLGHEAVSIAAQAYFPPVDSGGQE